MKARNFSRVEFQRGDINMFMEEKCWRQTFPLAMFLFFGVVLSFLMMEGLFLDGKGLLAVIIIGMVLSLIYKKFLQQFQEVAGHEKRN